MAVWVYRAPQKDTIKIHHLLDFKSKSQAYLESSRKFKRQLKRGGRAGGGPVEKYNLYHTVYNVPEL